jgi:hypothetical protein
MAGEEEQNPPPPPQPGQVKLAAFLAAGTRAMVRASGVHVRSEARCGAV